MTVVWMLYDELMAMTKDAEEVANDEAIARIQAIRDGQISATTRHERLSHTASHNV